VTQKAANGQDAIVQATIIKKCDRAYHRPESNKACKALTCQHTCDTTELETCPHKWTVRYSVNSRQREQSFTGLSEAQTFQLSVTTGKRTQGAMFADPRAGVAEFLPLCDRFIGGMAKGEREQQGHLPVQLRQPGGNGPAERPQRGTWPAWTPR
jgi:hypothetical protein